MLRRNLFRLAAALLIAGLAAGFVGTRVLADVGGVFSNVPQFGPGQPVTITVTAEDDDGALVIRSSLASSTLTVVNCTGVGPDQVAGRCDGSGKTAVTGQGTTTVTIDTTALDSDQSSEPLTVTLTLVASCTTAVAVTVSADQPGNVGPDDVTINCAPPTPTPSPTPTNTPTPAPSATPAPTATPVPPTAVPLTSSVLGVVTPPSTGDGGLK
jgi:hypothetical protein